MLTVASPGGAFSVTAVVLGGVAAAANIVGGLAMTGRQWGRGFVRYFLALGSGFMLATVVLEMVPDSLRLDPRHAALFLLLGFLLVHLVEHSFVTHFHFGEETHTGAFERPHVPYSVLCGLAVHTLFDGIALGSGFLVSPWLGWIIFAAVFMHKIPEGLTVASVMLAAGRGARAALLSAVVIGVASLVGVLAIQLFPFGLTYALPLSAGVTMYVAATDLLPEVNREPSIPMALWVFCGAGLLILLRHLFSRVPV